MFKTFAVTAILLTTVGFSAMAQEGSITLLSLEEPSSSCRLEGNSAVPAIGSLILPGLGQLANGEDTKALIHLGIATGIPLGLSVLNAISETDFLRLDSVIGLAVVVVQLAWHSFSALDAHQISSDSCSQ